MPTRTETLTLGGKSIRLRGSLPATPPVTPPATPPAGTGPRPAILLLHGAGGNTDSWLSSIAAPLNALGLAVYAVHYFDRTGTVRAELRDITDPTNVKLWLDTIAGTVRHLAGLETVDPRRIALVGVSLGAYLALALATERTRPAIRCIVEISGGLVEPFAANATATFPPTLLLHGDSDNVIPVSNAYNLHALLDTLGVAHRLEVLPAEGHWFSPAAQGRIAAAAAAFLTRYLKP